MTNLTPDTELEGELQEIYIQATHWFQDISFLETETNFFKTIIDRCQPVAGVICRNQEFYEKIQLQYDRLEALKAKIPEFLAFVQPFIGEPKKPIHLDFLNRYNKLKNELDEIFTAIRDTKNELFHYTETVRGPKKKA